MLNTNRIVPVTATDLITLYGVILSQSVEGLTTVDVTKGPGIYGGDLQGSVLLTEPLVHADLAEFAAGVLYFVPAYDYQGIQVGPSGTATGLVDPDGCTLYKAVIADGAATITPVGPQTM